MVGADRCRAGSAGAVQDVQAVCKHCADLPTLRNALNISAVQAKSVRCRQKRYFSLYGGSTVGTGGHYRPVKRNYNL